MALPAQLNPSLPEGHDVAATGHTRMTALKQFLTDFLGVLNATSLTAAPFAIATDGVVTFSQAGSPIATSPRLTTPWVTTGLNDTNGNELIEIAATASAVNQLKISNAATGTDPILEAVGDDTNIDLDLTPAGAGIIQINGSTLGIGGGITYEFAAGVTCIFGTATPPTGWTQTAHNDQALRVVSGAGGGTGGSVSINGGSITSGTGVSQGLDTSLPDKNVADGAHTHNWSSVIKYLDVITASKDA